MRRPYLLMSQLKSNFLVDSLVFSVFNSKTAFTTVICIARKKRSMSQQMHNDDFFLPSFHFIANVSYFLDNLKRNA